MLNALNLCLLSQALEAFPSSNELEEKFQSRTYWEKKRRELDALRARSRFMGLDLTADKCDEILKRDIVEPFDFDRPALFSLAEKISELADRFQGEMSHRMSFVIDVGDEPYYKENQFGNSCSSTFPNSSYDMLEAGKCFALDRYTACVFHLMRIAEDGRNFIVQKFDLGHCPTWDAFLKRIDKWIESHPDRSKEIASLREVKTRIETVKNAWRNKTMHLDKKYTGEEAKEIFNAIKYFMGSLIREFS